MTPLGLKVIPHDSIAHSWASWGRWGFHIPSGPSPLLPHQHEVGGTRITEPGQVLGQPQPRSVVWKKEAGFEGT